MANARAIARIGARIHERVAYCLEFELNDPRAAFITVMKVEVSSDLAVAKVFYSVYGSAADRSKVAHMLEDASGFVRKRVGRVLKTRHIPRLRWIFDDSVEFQSKMEDIIASALEHDREVNPHAHSAPVGESESATPEDATSPQAPDRSTHEEGAGRPDDEERGDASADEELV